MKRRIRLTEGDLRRIVNKSVRRALNEVDDMDMSNDQFDDVADRIKRLKQQSRTYGGDTVDKHRLTKSWNRGMGRQSFIQVLPEEGVILYSSLLTYNRDLDRIRDLFPEYELIKVDKPYWSTRSLKAHRDGTAQH